MQSVKEFLSRLLNGHLEPPPDVGKMDEATVKAALDRQEPRLPKDVSFEQIVRDVQDILLAKIAWVSLHNTETPSDGKEKNLISLAHNILVELMYPIAVRRPGSQICQVHLPHDYLTTVIDDADPAPDLRANYTHAVTEQWRCAASVGTVDYLHRLRHNIFRSYSADALRPELRGNLEPVGVNVRGAPETVALYCMIAAGTEQKELVRYLDELWAHGWCHNPFVHMLIRSALSSPQIFSSQNQLAEFRVFAAELDERCKQVYYPGRWNDRLQDLLDYLSERYTNIDADLLAARCESRSMGEWLRRIFQLAPKIFEVLFQLRLSEQVTLSPDERDDLNKMARYYEEIYVDIYTCLIDPLFFVPSVLVGEMQKCHAISEALLTLEFFCGSRVFIPDFIKTEIAEALNRSTQWPLPEDQDLLAALHLKLRASLGNGFEMAYNTLHGEDYFQRQRARANKFVEARSVSHAQGLSPLSQALLSALITYSQEKLSAPPSAGPIFIEQQTLDTKLQYVFTSELTLHAVRCGPLEDWNQFGVGKLVRDEALFEQSTTYIVSKLEEILHGLEVAYSMQIPLTKLKFVDVLCNDTSWYVRAILRDGSVWALSPWRGPPELGSVELGNVQTGEELLEGFVLVSSVANSLKVARPSDFKGKVTIAMPPEIEEHAGKLSRGRVRNPE